MSIKELSDLIGNYFEIDASDFSEDTVLSEFISDDVELSLLVEAVENEFGVVISDGTAESWRLLSDVIATLDRMS